MAGLVQVVQKPLSTEQPTEKDAKLSEGLMALMNAECLIPSQDESNRRVKAIGKLNEMVSQIICDIFGLLCCIFALCFGQVREFVRNVLDSKSLSDMPADDTTYRLRVFGSYRLDVHLPGADMDTLVIVVRQIDRKDMFTQLFELLHSRPAITKLVKVEETRVPIIKVSLAFMKHVPTRPDTGATTVRNGRLRV